MHFGKVCFTLMALSPLSVYAALSFNSQLETAESFAILAAETVTNTGPTIVSGDLGLYAGTAVTGFTGLPQGTVVNGSIYASDGGGVAAQAQADLQATYTAAANEECGIGGNLTGQNLGGMTLFAGVYCFDSEAGLTGPTPLTLDAQGQSEAIFLFQIGSTLITGSGSSIALVNGAEGGNVFWQVGSSATLGTNSVFAGTIMALESISLTTGANITCGRALAITGAVTMDTNEVDTCLSSNIPEPSSALLLLVATPGLYWLRRRKR